MKILVIRFSSIGDIVLTTPVMRCLKKQLPGLELHYLTKKSFAPIFKANPYVDRMHYLEDDLDAVIAKLKEEQFDWVIDLHHNLRTLKVKQALKVPSKSFDKLNIGKWIFTNFKVNTLPNVHIVDRYMDTVKHLGVKNDGAGLDYFIPAEEEVKANDIPASHQVGYIGLVIGAALGTKQLPLERLKELAAIIEHPIVLLGGPEDAENGAAIAATDPIKIYNACGKFSLNESADLVRKSRLVITHDTGLMHIAAAFRKPIISVWGNTVPAFGMYPYFGELGGSSVSARSAIVEVDGLRCRPCSKIGYSKCPKGHFKCMQQIDLGRIKLLAQQLLSGRT